jgi:hypothetical protein
VTLPVKHHRKSTRLQGYDYSQAGGYFVTMVTHGRECLFGKIQNDEMILNDAGKMVVKWWYELPGKFPTVKVDAFVVMPNHFHGVILIHKTVGADLRVGPGDMENPFINPSVEEAHAGAPQPNNGGKNNFILGSRTVGADLGVGPTAKNTPPRAHTQVRPNEGYNASMHHYHKSCNGLKP